MGLKKGGLYNGGESPEERDRKREKKKKERWVRFTVSIGRTLSEVTNSSKNILLGHDMKQPTYSKIYSSDLSLPFDYVFYPPQTDS